VADPTSCDELDTLVGKKSSFWPKAYPCPLCAQPATGMHETEADPRVLRLMLVRDVTPQEAFAAFNGLGFPDEQVCGLAVVEDLLRSQPIRRVVGTDIPRSGRMVLDALELWDGTKLHLGAAAEGAIVYRIVRPHSYAAKLEEGVTACPSK
jgi:hypothetical protein